MSYFFREMETFKDSEAIASQVYRHDTLKSAEAQYHQTLASALVNDNIEMVVCEVLSPNGTLSKMESYVDRVVPEPTPTPES